MNPDPNVESASNQLARLLLDAMNDRLDPMGGDFIRVVMFVNQFQAETIAATVRCIETMKGGGK